MPVTKLNERWSPISSRASAALALAGVQLDHRRAACHDANRYGRAFPGGPAPPRGRLEAAIRGRRLSPAGRSISADRRDVRR